MSQSAYSSLGRNHHQIIRDGSFATKKEYIENQLFNHHLVEHNMTIQGLLKKLHALLIHQKVPEFYGYFFMGQLMVCPEERILDSINREIQQLKNKQSHYHHIIKSVIARETCLKSIAACLDAMFEETRPGLIAKLTEEVRHLRLLTILVVQPIKKWKEYLQFISPNIFEDEHIAFFYQNEDYLLKILRDTEFISKSFLSDKVTFSYKQDPFIMRPFTQDPSGGQFVNIFKFQPQDQQKYMTCLQYLADERADYLKRKIAARTDKIKEIERVYQANQLSDRILITKVNPIALRKVKQSINEAPIDFIDQGKNEEKNQEKRTASRLSKRQRKNREINQKDDKIKKIKQMDLGSSSPLINVKKFNSVNAGTTNNANALPIARSISLGLFKRVSLRSDKSDREKESQSDFENILRKKQLKILENDSIKRRTLSTVRLKDRLSERKLLDNKQGAQQLRKILDQIQHSAPQIQDNYFIKKESTAKTGRNLIQQNEEIVTSLREKILKEISDDTVSKQKIQQHKMEQNNYLDKIIKMKLDNHALKSIQAEKTEWIEGKDVLASELGKKELFGMDNSPQRSQKLVELQEELKHEMQLKFLRQVQEELSHRSALSKQSLQRKKQQKQREKQLQVVMRKKELEERYESIEKQQRNKIVIQNLEDEQRRRKQIQSQMQSVIEREQQKLYEFSQEQKMKLETELKESMKEKLLLSLRKEKSVLQSQKQSQQKRKQMQEQHRLQVRKRMQEEFHIEKSIERQRDRQEKTRKLRLVAQKMDHLENQLDQSKIIRQQSRKIEKMEELKQSINNFPVASSRVHEQSKKKLREEFQLQLFAFNRPQNLKLQQDNFIVKDFRTQIDNQQNLNKRVSEKSEVNLEAEEKIESRIMMESFKPKETSLVADKVDHSQTSENFVRFSQEEKDVKDQNKVEITQAQLQKMGLNMTPDEYMIYKKKKETINLKRINPPKIDEIQMKKMKNILDDFQKMSNLDEEKPYSPQSKMRFSQIQEDNLLPYNKIEQKDKLNEKKMEESPKKSRKKQRQNDSQDLSQVMKLTVHSKMGNTQKKKFVTSDQDQEQFRSPNKKVSKENSPSKKKSKKVSSEEEIQKQFDKVVPKFQNAALKIVPSDRLDEVLTQHFKKLPKLMRKLNLLKKDELLKSFEDYKTLIIVQVINQTQAEGLVFAVQNENKQNIRSLNIIHFGAYKPEETINLLIKARDLLFFKDPCAQLTFSMYYNKEDEQQQTFIKNFEKQFDPYGAIFQKKISNDQTQRKHVLRRMIGEESVPVSKGKTIGQLKVNQCVMTHPVENSLGVDAVAQKTGKQLGSWTLLSLFLSKYGKEQQIVKQLTSQVSDQSKNIKHLSKMVMKLKNSRTADIQYQSFDSPFQANLKLIQLNEELIKCDPKVQEENIPIIIMRSNIIISPTLPFFSSTAKFHYKKAQKVCNYLRLKCSKGSKVLKLKSSLYSSVMTVIPCKPTNYKILLIDASQFDSISSKTSLDLYIKLFLANVAQHLQNTDENIWIPQMSSQSTSNIQYFQQFGFNNQLRNKMDFSYTQYVQNCVSFEPTHRDLFIAPPYIIAVLNSEIQKTTQGSPIYIERIDLKNLKGVKDVVNEAQSDF